MSYQLGPLVEIGTAQPPANRSAPATGGLVVLGLGPAAAWGTTNENAKRAAPKSRASRFVRTAMDPPLGLLGLGSAFMGCPEETIPKPGQAGQLPQTPLFSR